MKTRTISMGVAAYATTVLLASLVFLPGVQAEVQSRSSISANFNGDSIAGGDVIWFATILQWVGNSPTATTQVHMGPSTLTITEPNGTTLTRQVPRGEVNFSVTSTTATTVWERSTKTWVTTVPATYKGNVFLTGFAFIVPPAGLPASSKVNWTGELRGDAHLLAPKCIDVNRQWAAAVYTSFTRTRSDIGIKPVDDNKMSVYPNSDHAGTPENFTAYLAQGATGGGGSNYTGSYSSSLQSKMCNTWNP